LIILPWKQILMTTITSYLDAIKIEESLPDFKVNHISSLEDLTVM